MYDHRLVQTAVIGHKNSDHPVILPMDEHELDVWRRAHPTYTYWCGVQLDGCGGELSDRRYTNKVCHFAHHPSAPECHRTATGESSADHLFIKRGVQRLLTERKLRGTVRTRNLGTGPGDAVDVYLPEGRRRLRFQLSTINHRAWRRASDALTADTDADDIDWIFASGGPLAQQVIGRHGYCLRVRLETVGGERRVHIGAEARDRTVDWTPLEDCELTPGGIVTPRVERLRISDSRPGPAAFSIEGGWAFAPVPGSVPPADSPFGADGRRLVVADMKPAEGPIVRALISLPGDSKAPPTRRHVYRVHDGGRLLLLENGQGWVAEANRYERLNDHDAQRTGLSAPPPASQPSITPRAAQGTSRPTEPRAEPEVRADSREPVRAATVVPGELLTRAELVTALREALIDHARLRSTTTWEALFRTVSSDLAQYSEETRQRLLVEVDSPLREDVPVLSALIREGDGPPPGLRDVLRRLGVLYSGVSTEIDRWAAVETERAFAAYAVPPKAMPARVALKPKERAKRSSGSTVVGTQQFARRAAGASSRDSSSKVTFLDAVTIRQVHTFVSQLKQLLPLLHGDSRRQAEEALAAARTWLTLHDKEVRLTAIERKKLWAQAPRYPLVYLSHAVEAAQERVAASERVRKYDSDAHETEQPTAE